MASGTPKSTKDESDAHKSDDDNSGAESDNSTVTDKKLNDFYLERQAEYDRKRAERKARRK